MITPGMTCNMIMIIIVSIMIMLPILGTAQSYRNVSLGTSIVADGTNSSWSSPSGEFAFGFHQVSPGGYLLAIWFDKITEKTIVWSANRDNLAPRGSRIQLVSDGRLELNGPGGQQIWSASPGRPGMVYGAMLDSGNFVLAANASSSVLWQSFEHPTDTLLPSQIMSQGVTLISSFSAANYSKGRFTFTLRTDGNLVLYTRNFPMDDSIGTYWASETVGSASQLVFNQSGYA